MYALFSFHRKVVMLTEISEHMKKSINTISRQLDILNIHQRSKQLSPQIQTVFSGFTSNRS